MVTRWPKLASWPVSLQSSLLDLVALGLTTLRANKAKKAKGLPQCWPQRRHGIRMELVRGFRWFLTGLVTLLAAPPQTS